MVLFKTQRGLSFGNRAARRLRGFSCRLLNNLARFRYRSGSRLREFGRFWNVIQKVHRRFHHQIRSGNRGRCCQMICRHCICGQWRLGPLTRSIQDQRLRAIPTPFCQRRRRWNGQNRRLPHAAFDHICNLGLNTLVAWRIDFVEASINNRQFRFRHRLAAFDQTGHARQNAQLRRLCVL